MPSHLPPQVNSITTTNILTLCIHTQLEYIYSINLVYSILYTLSIVYSQNKKRTHLTNTLSRQLALLKPRLWSACTRNQPLTSTNIFIINFLLTLGLNMCVYELEYMSSNVIKYCLFVCFFCLL